jgi:hypothetical protein
VAAKAAVEDVAKFGFNGGEAGIDQFAAWNDDDVEAWRELVMAENLSNQSFRSVPDHRAPDLARGRDAEPPDLEIVR